MTILLPLDDNGNPIQMLGWLRSTELLTSNIYPLSKRVEIITVWADKHIWVAFDGTDNWIFVPANTDRHLSVRRNNQFLTVKAYGRGYTDGVIVVVSDRG